MCTSPITLKSYRYRVSPKNENDTAYKVVPCGKCPECLRTRSNQWSFRLLQELKSSQSAYFVTLTYDDAYIPFSPQLVESVSKTDVKTWLRKLRRLNQRFWLYSQFRLNHNKFDRFPKCCRDILMMDCPSFKYFLSSEYGAHTHRPHYHALFFNWLWTPDSLCDSWQFGNSFVGDVTEGSVRYVTKYFVNRSENPDGSLDNFTFTSNGLGASYLDNKDNVEYLTRNKDNNCRLPLLGGGFCSIPRFYKDKLFIRFSYDINQTPVEHYAKRFNVNGCSYPEIARQYVSWLSGQDFNFFRNIKKLELL